MLTCRSAEAFGILGRNLESAQGATHRISGVALRGDFDDAPPAGRGYSGGGFVGLHLNEVLIGFHFLAWLDENLDDGGLGDGFAQLRHDNWHLGHDYI